MRHFEVFKKLISKLIEKLVDGNTKDAKIAAPSDNKLIYE